MNQIQINQNENQLITINNKDTQNIDINQDENQLIYISNEGSAFGITNVLVNGVSVVSGNIAYVIVPTKTSELANDSGYITKESDPTVPTYIKTITLSDINKWNNKQDTLVSGTNIKTINNNSLLGSGNITIEGSTYTAGTGIEITNSNVINNLVTSYNELSDLPTIPTKTSDLINDNNFVSSNSLASVAFSGSYLDLTDDPVIPQNTSDLYNDSGFITNTVNDLTNYTTTSNLNTLLSGKQDTLVSGTNIKTINNTSLLGSGDITIGGGGGTPTDVQINGTSITSNNVADIITEGVYNSTTNKIATMSEIPTNTSDLTNDSNFAVTNADNNFSTAQTISGNLTVTGKIDNTKSIEIYNTTPYIDFHFNNSSSDYTSRIIEYNSGTLTMENNLNVNGEVTSYLNGAGQFRAIGGNYGFFIRNDGGSTYFMLTDSGSQTGSWNSLRPLTINNSTGKVSSNGINIVDTYSTNEIAIGTWTNGSTLYRKVITGSISGSGKKTLNHGISGATMFTHIYGTIQDGTYYSALPFGAAIDNVSRYGFGIQGANTTGTFDLFAGSAMTGTYQYTVIFEYIK